MSTLNKKKRKKILFRTEASSNIGMGHLIRSLSLAQMLKENFEISFLLNQHSENIERIIASEGFDSKCITHDENEAKEELEYQEADIVVLDGYNFNETLQKSIKGKGKSLVYIDDIHKQHFWADAIINVSDSVTQQDYSAESYTRFLLGSKYALLRPEFIEWRRTLAKEIKTVSQVMISMGGADSGNISLKILRAIENIPSIKKTHIIIGALNLHEQELMTYAQKQINKNEIIIHKNISAQKMGILMNECELVICPASGTCLEAAAVGTGIISGYTAENQLGILNGLINKKCVSNIGNFNLISEAEITLHIESYIKNAQEINAMIKNQKRLIDGLSPQRLRRVFNELAIKIEFRAANLEDAKLYYDWANDDLVRANSYESNKISFDDHMKWFSAKLNSADCFFYLFTVDKIPAGQVRIENKTNETVIGISIDPHFRGKGLGPQMLEMASSDYLKKFPQNKIYAYIKESNTASFTIFKKANFKNDESVIVSGIKSVKLSKAITDEF